MTDDNIPDILKIAQQLRDDGLLMESWDSLNYEGKTVYCLLTMHILENIKDTENMPPLRLNESEYENIINENIFQKDLIVKITAYNNANGKL